MMWPLTDCMWSLPMDVPVGDDGETHHGVFDVAFVSIFHPRHKHRPISPNWTGCWSRQYSQEAVRYPGAAKVVMA